MLFMQKHTKVLDTAEVGNQVLVHYRGRFDDGTVFDSTFEDKPIEFKIGEGKFLKKFEEAVEGLSIGETIILDLNEDEAYGSYVEAQKFEVPVEELPRGLTPEKGMMIQGHIEDGSPHMFKIAEVLDETVLMDANHPLAGKSLRFEIKLVDILST